MQAECELCVLSKGKGGVYDFKNICCRVRLLVNLKLRENRIGWLGVWRRKDGNTVAEEIKKQFLQELENQKCLQDLF